MLRSDGEVASLNHELGEPGLYMDPILGRSRRHYPGFVKDLRKAGLLDFTVQPSERCDIVLVKKKNKKLRMILDARCANRRFNAAPSLPLLSSEGFGRIEVSLAY